MHFLPYTAYKLDNVAIFCSDIELHILWFCEI